MSVSPTIPKAAWISFVALIAASGSLAAESITLRPVADTSLFVLNGGSNNFGANTTLVVGTTASGSTNYPGANPYPALKDQKAFEKGLMGFAGLTKTHCFRLIMFPINSPRLCHITPAP